jgi:putative ABC transport system permease protein
MSSMLGQILDVTPGSPVQVEVLEGARPVATVPVAALVDDSMGLQAYMDIDAVRRLMREGGVITGAAVTLDRASKGAFYQKVKTLPVVAGVSLRDVMLGNFRDTMAQNMNLQIFINVIFAGIINEVYRLSFGVAPATVAWSFLVVIAAAFLSGLVVRRRLDRLDLVAVLKTRE